MDIEGIKENNGTNKNNKMKNIFIINCFITFTNVVSSQSNHTNTIISIIDSVYSHYSEFNYSESDDSLLHIADSLLLLEIFKKDSILSRRMSLYYTYRKFLGNDSGWSIPKAPIESKLMIDAGNYCVSLKKSYEDSLHRIDSIVFNNDVELLDYLPDSQDTSFLGILFRNSNTREQYLYAYNKLNLLLDSAQITKFYYDNINYFPKDTLNYFFILKQAKEDKKPYPFNSITEQQYLNLYDTTDYHYKQYYHSFFLNDTSLIKAEEDSINEARYQIMEANFREDLRLRQIEEEEYYRINDSISLATIYDRIGMYWKYAYSDTTLWNADGTVPVLEVDDGMRFDTLTTEEIFFRLNAIDFHEVYDTAQSMWSLNHKVVTIHLRKIFQILGDRCAYGLFVPDSSQRQLLDQWIDDYYSMACIDTIYYKSNEACNQMLRMWRLLFPKLKNWIGIEGKCANGMICVLQQLSNMITESMVFDLIADGDQALANGDTARVETLGNFLARVWRYLDIPENQRMQRRPVRTAVETQQWVDAYIYPALVRWNHPSSWK